ncbi:hypothetical protein [Micrococcus luteus]|uniref:hypothetical protein n=1 Tax=Micrococcus luteus TaxID=1270 RepID=UPI00332B2394
MTPILAPPATPPADLTARLDRHTRALDELTAGSAPRELTHAHTTLRALGHTVADQLGDRDLTADLLGEDFGARLAWLEVTLLEDHAAGCSTRDAATTLLGALHSLAGRIRIALERAAAQPVQQAAFDHAPTAVAMVGHILGLPSTPAGDHMAVARRITALELTGSTLQHRLWILLENLLRQVGGEESEASGLVHQARVEQAEAGLRPMPCPPITAGQAVSA